MSETKVTRRSSQKSQHLVPVSPIPGIPVDFDETAGTVDDIGTKCAELRLREVELAKKEELWRESRLGTMVRRFFPGNGKNGIWINAIVVKFLPEDVDKDEMALWHVRHMDSDEEDLEKHELLQAIEDHEACLRKESDHGELDIVSSA